MSAKRRWTGWIVAVVVLLGGGGWLVRRAAAGAQKLPSAQVQMGDLDEYVSCRGTLSAQQAGVLIAPNRVESLRIIYLAPGGSEVKKGAVVVRLDVSGLEQKATELALALKTAQAKLSQAEAEAEVTHQKDVLTLVEDQVAAGTAQNDARKASVQSRIAGQEADGKLATAQAEVSAQQASGKLHSTAAAAQVQSLREARDKAAAQLQREQATVAEATLRAPMAGVVTYSMNYRNFNDPHPYRVGDVVSAGDEIAQIPNLQTLEVDADLEQTDRGKVHIGDAITAQAPALPEVQLTGAVERIAGLTSLDFSGSFPPPRIFRLTASLTHPNARLRPQMKVTMKVITRELHQVALVPARAIFTRDGHAIVYLQQAGHYPPKRVTLLGRNPTEAAIRGLGAGASVALVQPGTKAPRKTANPAGAAGLEGTQP